MPITPYIEGSTPNYALPVNTASINTSEIDPYRQGVELTLNKHHQLGNLKISSGYEDHQIPQHEFGQNVNKERTVSFSDVDVFDPIKYIEVQALGGDVSEIFTFPIQIGDNDQRENTNFDGVIEPLSLRPKISFFSTDVPFESHDVFGEFGIGNNDSRRFNSQITQFYDMPNRMIFTSSHFLSPRNNGIGVVFGGTMIIRPQFYLDAFETMGQITLPVAMNDVFSTIQPYTDGLTLTYYDVLDPTNNPSQVGGAENYTYNALYTKKGAMVSVHELYDVLLNASQKTILSATLQMTSSTDSYIPPKKRSMPTGYMYDNSPMGVDSLAFGGKTYYHL